MNNIPDRSSPGLSRTALSVSSQGRSDKLVTGGPNTKEKMKIGFWNVRTMYEAGQLRLVTNEMKRYGLDILGVSESRWNGSGKFVTSTGETVFYSGREDGNHQHGVAVLLKEGLEKCLLNWKPVNSRILTMRLRGKQINTTIVQCYSPTNDGSDEDKDDFYNQLQAVVNAAPRHDITIVMGDLNAKVGRDNTNFESIMGKQGVGEKNENGERLLEFCDLNNLVIGGTIFSHPDIHKLTWTSPNGRSVNQIDHFMISRRWRRSLLDVKVRRGADVGSDHFLVAATVKVKLKKTFVKRMCKKRYDIKKLNNDNIRTAFVIELRNRFQILQGLHEEESERDVNSEWQEIKKLYEKTSQDKIGLTKRQKSKDWIQQGTLDAIEERRKLKQTLLQTKSPRLRERLETLHKEVHRKIKRLVRQDKRRAMEELAEEAEEAAARKDQGKLHSVTKRICGKFKGNANGPIKDKQGNMLTSETEQEERWNQHFEEVLNRPPPDEIPEITEADTDLQVDISPPKKIEIVNAINSLKNGKSPGMDNLNAELFKTDPQLSATILQPLFISIWESEKAPDEWTQGKIVKVPKKGALSDCNNWRGITLLSIPSKILSKIIIQRLSEAVDREIRKEQAGFRKGRGCADHIFTLRNIIEQCVEWQRKLYVNFVDFEKAFDSIHRDSLWRILRHYGIPRKLVGLIKSFYNNFQCTVGTSDIFFDVKTGVRQGCVMSAMLFNLTIDWVMRNTTNVNRGIRWTLFSNLEDLDFADDLALLSHTYEHMQEKTDRLSKFGGQVGLKINTKKTETIALNIQQPRSIQVNGNDLKHVNKFTYLGSVLCPDGGAKEDINNRLGKARAAFRSMDNVWRSTQYSTSTKVRLYQSCIVAKLLYGAECWRMTVADLNKLKAFHTTCLRRILRIFWPQRITNQEVLERCHQKDMEEIITKRRWSWIGHVLRRNEEAIVRTSLHWTPEGKRKRGKPKTTWRRTVEREMKSRDQTWGQLTRMAQDRFLWSNFVAALNAT